MRRDDSAASTADRGYAKRVDQEVARTLADLELKLRELERELTSIGRRQSVTATQPSAVAQQPSGAQPSSVQQGASLARSTGGQPGVLVDEAVERRYSMDAQQTVYGEIPATKDAQQSIDLAELVRFKETMQRTLQGLIDEYSRLLSLRPPGS